MRRLFSAASFVGCADIRVFDVTETAADCRPGVVFAARPGHHHHGSDFVGEALQRGASALIVSQPLPGVAVPQCVLPHVGRGYGILCASLAGRPMRSVRTAGVTGTNGKTTVTWLIRSLLNSAGHDCGLLGTIEYSDGEYSEPATLTTPGAKDLWRWFAAMARRSTPFAAIELSSHALHQDRAAGAELELAVVTNITHEHLDYHGTAAGYFASKAKIVSLVRPGGAVILNQDDCSVDTLRPRVPAGVDVMTFALRRRAAVTAGHIRRTETGTRFTLSLRGRQIEVETRLIGRHNVANCLAAVAAADHFGLDVDQIIEGLARADAPPGRLQRIPHAGPFEVLVDYAHTPDALEKAIAASRALASGRVIVVFGAGGDRDRTKRPLLGNAASGADVAIVTSDNPRSENPSQIIDEILVGFASETCEAFIEPNRAAAITQAIGIAEPGDVVLIAGKGHETTQIVADGSIPFDDRVVAANALRALCEPVISEPIAA